MSHEKREMVATMRDYIVAMDLLTPDIEAYLDSLTHLKDQEVKGIFDAFADSVERLCSSLETEGKRHES